MKAAAHAAGFLLALAAAVALVLAWAHPLAEALLPLVGMTVAALLPAFDVESLRVDYAGDELAFVLDCTLGRYLVTPAGVLAPGGAVTASTLVAHAAAPFVAALAVSLACLPRGSAALRALAAGLLLALPVAVADVALTLAGSVDDLLAGAAPLWTAPARAWIAFAEGGGRMGLAVATGLSRLRGYVGYIDRVSQIPARDFSGPGGKISYEWTPTGKTLVELFGAREILPYQDIFTSFALTKVVGVNTTWQPVSKVTVKAGANRTVRDYLGDPGLVVAGLPAREDRTNTVTGSVNYAFSTNILGSLSVVHQIRASNRPNLDYTDTTVFANLQFTY
jgi:hypothetical protein